MPAFIYAHDADATVVPHTQARNGPVARKKMDDAIEHYAAVEKKYPQQRWEALMSLKCAADLLWDAGRLAEAKAFYQKITNQYDRPEASQVEQMILRGSKSRLPSAPPKEPRP